MDVNWITLIGGLLLISPILLGWIRGLPTELELLKYRVASTLHSILWVLSFLVVTWGLYHGVVNHPDPIPQVLWLKEQLDSGLIPWIIAVTMGALFMSWLLDFLVQPITVLIGWSLSRIQGWANRIPTTVGRGLAALLEVPRAVLRVLLLIVGLHFVLPYLPFTELSQMVQRSSLYQWVDQNVISPMVNSSWYEQKLPVLGERAENWLYTLSQEATKNGPEEVKPFVSWQTRFHSHAEIDAKARTIVKGAQTDREKAYHLYTWIGSHIKYDYFKAEQIEKGQFRSLTFGAIPTYESRKGVCTDYSSLMVAMGKAVELHVEQKFGDAILPDGSRGPHAWNLVYLQDEKKWIPIDPTWQQSGDFFDNPDFYATHDPQ